MTILKTNKEQLAKTGVRTFVEPMICIFLVAAFAYGYHGLRTYALPLYQGDYKRAIKSPLADRSSVLLLGASAAYEQERVEEARKVIEILLEEIVDESGNYDESHRQKVEEARFLLGKCYQVESKNDKAIEQYKHVLRMSPDHYPAKYNLEMLIETCASDTDAAPPPPEEEPDGGKSNNGADQGKRKPKI